MESWFGDCFRPNQGTIMKKVVVVLHRFTVASQTAGQVGHPLSFEQMRLVGGGLPKGTWGAAATDLPKGTWSEEEALLPKGTW
jgi:hypothetical protein